MPLAYGLTDAPDPGSWLHHVLSCQSHPLESFLISVQMPCYRIQTYVDTERSSGIPLQYLCPLALHHLPVFRQYTVHRKRYPPDLRSYEEWLIFHILKVLRR